MARKFRLLSPVLLVPLAALFSLSAAPAEFDQSEREARRLEGELRREQEMARRQMEDRERSQIEALRSQEAAIQRLESTRSRIEANVEQIAQQSAEQARAAAYGNTQPFMTVRPESGARDELTLRNQMSGSLRFAPLSAQLGSYFGALRGVLVISSGAEAAFGLQDGDVVLSVDGRQPLDDRHLTGILNSYRPGEKVSIKVLRRRESIELNSVAPAQRRD